MAKKRSKEDIISRPEPKDRIETKVYIYTVLASNLDARDGEEFVRARATKLESNNVSETQVRLTKNEWSETLKTVV